MPSESPPSTSQRVLFLTAFYLEDVLLGVVDHARHRNWELISNMRFHRFLPTETEADGIIVLHADKRICEWLEKWSDTPVVHIGQPSSEIVLPCVDVDYEEAGRVGARHFLELGHVNFAYYTLSTRREADRTRLAFEEVLRESEREAVHLDFTALHGDEPMEVPREVRLGWLADRLAELKKPVAVMTNDDRRSLELVLACERLGLRIPQDVSILGCENWTVEQRMSPVPLSSVEMNWRLAGSRAAEVLDQLMDGQSVEKAVRVAPRCVVARASTATFVTDNEAITQALQTIRDQFSQSIRLADLARQAGMSQRQFRNEFKRLVGHSARVEVRRARLVAAVNLLRDTDLKLDAIAFECGLKNAKKLCEAFGEDYGMTPTAWRTQARLG